MIVSSRLGKVERIARAQHERYTAGMPTLAELAVALRDLFQQAEACRVRGDLDNEVVLRATRIAELFKTARQRKEQAWRQA